MKIVGMIGAIAGAVIMMWAGGNMMHIVSQATAQGQSPSIAEVFYNAMGLGFVGLGLFCIALTCIVAFRETHKTKEEEK